MKHALILFISLFLFSLLKAQTVPPTSGKTAITVDTDSTFAKVEFESEFPGGAAGWRTYLTENLHYPKKAVRKNIQGTVVVQFIVGKDGKVSDVQVIRSVDPLLDEEAMRLIKNSPNWTPALQSGKKVKSYKKQPIIFMLQ
jgi:periplasmic protein TonB